MNLQKLSGLVVALVLSACGSVDSGSEFSPLIDPGSGGTGSSPVQTMAIGPITQLDQVTINGITFDPSQADIFDPEGVPIGANQLRLGMFAEVSGRADPVAETGLADEIRIRREMIGAIDFASNDLLVVNSFEVVLDEATQFADLAHIKIGDVVAVHGATDLASQRVLATRVDLLSAADNKPVFTARIDGWDMSAQVFQSGGRTISYVPSQLPHGFLIGARYQLWIERENADWRLVRIESRQTGQPQEGRYVEIQDVVSSYTSLEDFWLGELRVNGGSAQIPASVLRTLDAGQYIEVEGTMIDGVIQASKIKKRRNPLQ